MAALAAAEDEPLLGAWEVVFSSAPFSLLFRVHPEQVAVYSKWQSTLGDATKS
jgi:hypothetical protein